MRILVTGASGYIGGRLIPRLLDEGHEVVAFVRNPASLQGAPWLSDVSVAHGDLTDRASIEQAVQGIDVLYYLVHSMASGRDFERQDRLSAQNVAAAAKTAGVGRIVYLGGLHPDVANLSPHLRSRAQVGDLLIASGVPTAALQAGVVIG